MKFLFLLLTIIILFSTSACEVINPDEDIPTRLAITSMPFNSKPLQGTDSVDVTDAWVYIDGELAGTFEMPFNAPLLISGVHQVLIRPGILLNGISATRTINPFFTNYEEVVDFKAGDTMLISPKSAYVDGLSFPWKSNGEEDFEEGSISIDSTSSSSTKIIKSNEDVFEGSYSGKIVLDAGHTNYYGQSSREFILPKSGAPVIMEIHVKNPTIGLGIGMFVKLNTGTIVAVPHMVVNPSSEWRKIYVNFTELVSYYTAADSYRVTFTAELGSESAAEIYLDNIKLIHK
jgi:hypothetical protein